MLKSFEEISKDLLVSTAKNISPLLWYSIAGGEPFIRKDLGKIISEIQQKSRPKILSLPTNGWYTKKTYQTVLEVMQKTNRGKFLVFFSIDGRNDAHDEIRGDNSYEKLKQTYTALSKLKKIYPRLYLGIIITVQNKNYHLFPGLIDEIYKEFNPTSISDLELLVKDCFLALICLDTAMFVKNIAKINATGSKTAKTAAR